MCTRGSCKMHEEKSFVNVFYHFRQCEPMRKHAIAGCASMRSLVEIHNNYVSFLILNVFVSCCRVISCVCSFLLPFFFLFCLSFILHCLSFIPFSVDHLLILKTNLVSCQYLVFILSVCIYLFLLPFNTIVFLSINHILYSAFSLSIYLFVSVMGGMGGSGD